MDVKKTLALVVLCLVFAPVANAQTSAQNSDFNILQSIAQSANHTSYEGEFTYEYDGKIDTLSISNIVEGNKKREVIEHLNGPVKRVSRTNVVSDCQLVGSYLLMGGVLPLLSGEKTSLAKHYQFVNRGVERIAGREAMLIQILPKDMYRYGLVLGVDKQSGLLSKIVITEGSKKVMERIQFVSLRMLPSNSGIIKKVNPNKTCELNAVQSQSPLRPGWMPSGFVLAQYTFSKAHGHMETYTDGLSAFSVFTSSRVLSDKKIMTRKGATVSLVNKVSVKDDDYMVSIVGEIPALSAQRIIQSLVFP